MSGVADEAGLSRGTIYRYFTNREELLVAMSEHLRSMLREGIESAATASGDARARIGRMLDHRHDVETRQAVRRLRELQPAFLLSFLSEYLPDLAGDYSRSLAGDFKGADTLISLDDFAKLMARLAVTEMLFDDDPGLTKALVLKLWDAIQPSANRRERPRSAARAKQGTGT